MHDITINMDSMLAETAENGRQPVRFAMRETDWEVLKAKYTLVHDAAVTGNFYKGVPVELKDLEFPRFLEYEDTAGLHIAAEG